MSLYDLIFSRRSIRKFKPNPIPRESLQKLVNAARLAPSAGNLQPLEFIVVDEVKKRDQVFSCMKWAGYIAPEGDPKPGQEPMAYIIILANTEVRKNNFERDSGAAVENMILSALEDGIGSCWHTSIDRENIRKFVGLPDSYEIDSVLSLGFPAETPVVEELNESVKYWKDEDGQLHVPKRKLEDVIHFNEF